MVLLISNAVQNALTYGSGKLMVGLVSAGTLLTIDLLMGSLFSRKPWIEKGLLGEPTVIAVDGRLDRKAMRREGIDENEVMAAVREQGLLDIAQVRLAVLEDDGSISVIPKK